MNTSTAYNDQSQAREEALQGGDHPGGASFSPFISNQLVPAADVISAAPTAFSEGLASPFSEAAGALSEGELENEAVEALLGELEDEEFTAALEALTQEAVARHAQALSGWSQEVAGTPSLAVTEVAQWLESVAQEAGHRLQTIAERFGNRTVDSLDESEFEVFEADLSESARPTSPLDAQEDFLKKLVSKVSKIGRGVARMAGKGLSALSRFLPIGKLINAVRRLVRPLLQKVLARAIGHLPAALQPAARQLAQKFRGEVEAFEPLSFGEFEAGLAAETLTDEFDRRLVSHLLASDEVTAEAEVAEYEAAAEQQAAERSGDRVAALDAARQELATYFGQAEHQADPNAQMQQFIPAVLPLVKLGISVVGRQRVVTLVAKLIARLIQPMVGHALAPVLSKHLASSGLALVGLEAEAAMETSTLGSDALVSVVEDTVREVFASEPEVLENDLLAAGIVQEAFAEAVTRHLPAEVLKAELRDEAEAEDERGVWVMMPRGGGAPYRFRVYSQRIPILLHRAAARHILLGDGETLEDRLLEAGVNTFPAPLEVEAYEMLPGGEVGHIVGAAIGESFPGEAGVLATEFEALDEAPRLNVLLPSRVAGASAPGQRGRLRRYLRIRSGGLPLRRHSPLSVRLDLTAPKPVLTVRVMLGERRAHLVATQLDRREYVPVIATFQKWIRGPMRPVLGRRLFRVLTRRGVTVTNAATTRQADRLVDAVAQAFSAGIVPAAARLAAAAKDPRAGVTVAFAFTFPSRDAIITGHPGKPVMSVTAGWHRG
ncbi:hypothetical protein [Arthrobacter sp. MDT1-65]